MKALDLYCCAGGAAVGLHNAGYEVTGVDIVNQPDYPFTFRQGNALDADLTGYDLVWASPPCQAHSTLKHRTGKTYECFIARTREKLKAWGGAYIIENVDRPKASVASNPARVRRIPRSANLARNREV